MSTKIQKQQRTQQSPTVVSEAQYLAPLSEKSLTPKQDSRNFLALIRKEINSSKGAKLMKRVWLFLVFILLSFFGKPYWELLQTIYNKIGGSGIAIIALVIILLGLLLLLEGARRLRKRELTFYEDRHDELGIKIGKRDRTIMEISRLYGVGKLFTEVSFHELLIKEHKDAYKIILERWRFDIEQWTELTISELPELAIQWRQWIANCMNELEKLIPASPIPHK